MSRKHAHPETPDEQRKWLFWELHCPTIEGSDCLSTMLREDLEAKCQRRWEEAETERRRRQAIAKMVELVKTGPANQRADLRQLALEALAKLPDDDVATYLSAPGCAITLDDVQQARTKRQGRMTSCG